ncbi:hypothetical protein ACOMHN_050447 [Nucella lapillus]
MASTGNIFLRTGRLIRKAQQSYMLTTQHQQGILGCTPQMRRCSQDSMTPQNSHIFNEKTLGHLVCPLSKKDLRYDKENNELVCDEVGVAYPIVNGIPNLVPQDARMLKNSSSSTESTES